MILVWFLASRHIQVTVTLLFLRHRSRVALDWLIGLQYKVALGMLNAFLLSVFHEIHALVWRAVVILSRFLLINKVINQVPLSIRVVIRQPSILMMKLLVQFELLWKNMIIGLSHQGIFSFQYFLMTSFTFLLYICCGTRLQWRYTFSTWFLLFTFLSKQLFRWRASVLSYLSFALNVDFRNVW